MSWATTHYRKARRKLMHLAALRNRGTATTYQRLQIDRLVAEYGHLRERCDWCNGRGIHTDADGTEGACTACLGSGLLTTPNAGALAPCVRSEAPPHPRKIA
jgi:hypothetical protein